MDFILFLQALINGLLLGGLLGLVAAGLTLVFGVLKIINFSHGSLLMLGMYSSYWLFKLCGVDPYLSVLIISPLFFLAGFLIQKLLINKIINAPPYNQLLFTLGLALFIDNMSAAIWSPDSRGIKLSYTGEGITLGSIEIAYTRVIMFVCAFIVMGGIYIILKKTNVGKAIRATSQEKEGSLAVGINVKTIYCVTFGIGSSCAGVAGSLLIPLFYVSPYVGNVFVLTAFVVVVLGGMGNFMGAFLGGLIIGIIEAFGALLLPGTLKTAITFIIFILILLFKPSGILGKKEIG